MGKLERQILPRWTEDLGALKAAEVDGARVHEKCSRCGVEGRVDLDEMIADVGARFTLWNFHPPCHRTDCDGRLWFRAQPRNYFHVILQDAPEVFVERLRQRWRATLQSDVRDSLPLLPMLEATGRIAIASCGRCQVTHYLGLTQLRSWLVRRSMIELEGRLRCAGGPPNCEIAVEMFPRELTPVGELQGD